MAKYITFSEYARLKGVSDRTVRNWKEQGKISVTTKLINNRNTLVVIVDDEPTDIQNSSKGSKPNLEKNIQEIQNAFEPIQDAEIIDDSQQYKMVSMENNTFDQLINSIKQLAESRAESDQKAMMKIENEYFETKAENKKLHEEKTQLIENLHSEKLLAAQLEAEIKISTLQIKELTEKINKQSELLSEYSEIINTLKQQLLEKTIETDNLNRINQQALLNLQELKENINKEKKAFSNMSGLEQEAMQKQVDELKTIKNNYNEALNKLLESESRINKLNADITIKSEQIQGLQKENEKLNNKWFNKL